MSSYYFARVLALPLSEAEARVTERLSKAGFGILTEIDVRATLRKKLGVDFQPYKILGACNPPLAHKALEIEDKIGTMLPCNVILQEIGERQTEVAAVDPKASMAAVENEELREVAEAVRALLKGVIEGL